MKDDETLIEECLEALYSGLVAREQARALLRELIRQARETPAPAAPEG